MLDRTTLFLTLASLTAAACSPSDPRLDDLIVSGSVAALDGTPLAGAAVTLVRTECSGTTCTPRVRGTDTTGDDGRFEIVVERSADETESWELVCHEFTLSVQASGHVPLVGNYEAWRSAFCASGEARGLSFRLESA